MPAVEPVTRASLFPSSRFIVQAARSFIASNIAALLSHHLPEKPFNDQDDHRTEHREPKRYVRD